LKGINQHAIILSGGYFTRAINLNFAIDQSVNSNLKGEILKIIKSRINFILLFFWISFVNAADTFDPQTGVLTIPLVNVNDTYYSNVKVIIGDIKDIGTKKSLGLAYDIYNTNTNELYIPIVNIGESTYYFVTITVGKVLSLEGNIFPVLKTNEPKAYKTSVTPNPPIVDPLLSISLPSNLTKPVLGSNLKVWISDPLNPRVGLKNGGLFITPDTTTKAWKYYGGSSDGSLSLTLDDGSYISQTVEPGGKGDGSTVYVRKTYSITVSNGVVNIKDARLDPSGYFILTITLSVKNQARDDLVNSLTKAVNDTFVNFKPTSPCMLKDQTATTRSLSGGFAGFPKNSNRLSSYGRIKALIVPVDFPDLQGVDNTLNFYSPIAKGMSDFYIAQSFGKVAFDFDIVSNWVRMPFLSTDFKRTQVGAVITGDLDGYVKALFQATDGPIDFNKYETVYFLVPKEMPMDTMNTGPTSSNFKTINGLVNSFSIGGADMYSYLRGGSPISAGRWIVHETGHQFGMFDEANSALKNIITLGNYSIMSPVYEPPGLELGSWDRYVQGWLSDKQFTCLSKEKLNVNEQTFILMPLQRQSNELKSIMIPLSTSKILVIESRKSEGYDVIANGNEGVLVYTVDMTLGQLAGGYQIQPRIGTTNFYSYSDGLLKAGDSITVENIKISVQKLSSFGDTVLVSYK